MRHSTGIAIGYVGATAGGRGFAGAGKRASTGIDMRAEQNVSETGTGLSGVTRRICPRRDIRPHLDTREDHAIPTRMCVRRMCCGRR